ncbi:hypothetical protein BH10PSE5_BH10PSE5_19520 [soil metagenome]
MTLHFLSGLPRSGSTLLAAILNQNPLIKATSTSGLTDMMGAAVAQWEGNPTLAAQGRDEADLMKVLRGMVDGAVSAAGRPVLLDKSRTWADPGIITTMERVLAGPVKIVATVRNVEDCVASFARIAKPDHLGAFLQSSPLIAHLRSSYGILAAGYQAFPDRFLFVEYEDLLADPHAQLERVYGFLGISGRVIHDLENIDGSAVQERDAEVWGVPGLHDIAPRLGRQSAATAAEVLGSRLHEFRQPAFWRGECLGDRPTELLDLQLQASIRGDHEAAWAMLEQLAVEQPDNPRAAFNRGWYLMAQGHLLEGHRQLAAGRDLGVWGSPPVSGAPIWTPGARETVLLNLEGGLGDQLHAARYVANLIAGGAQVLLACSPELAPILKDQPGVRAVVARDHAGWVLHDSQVPGLDAPLALGLEWSDVVGRPYIARPKIPTHGRVGLRWQGNPQFEHEQHRQFPPELLFEAVEGLSTDFVSLQRDSGAEDRPAWCVEVDLRDWRNTQDAIAQCELVITSCTSVAHLAGAMGVETWVVIPASPYFIWAAPGDGSPHYDSVRLFRQGPDGDWATPFNEIREALRGRSQ